MQIKKIILLAYGPELKRFKHLDERQKVHRTSARLVTRLCISSISSLQIAFRTTSPASDAATAKACFRCATTPPWMGFFTARPILNSCSRRQAPSANTSPQVRRQTMNSLRFPTSYHLCSVELETSVLLARRLCTHWEDDLGG